MALRTSGRCLSAALMGTYVAVEPFHLFRYLDEQAFRYNNRATKENKVTDAARFDMAVSNMVGKRLTFCSTHWQGGRND
jgi:hypothetical protein